MSALAPQPVVTRPYPALDARKGRRHDAPSGVLTDALETEWLSRPAPTSR